MGLCTEHRHDGGGVGKLIELTRALYSGEEIGEIHPGNEDIWEVLIMADTQWRTSGFGGPYGLDYVAVTQVAHGLGLARDRTFFQKVRAYEQAALDVMHAKGKGDACTQKQKAQCALEFPDSLEWACKQCKEMKEKRR